MSAAGSEALHVAGKAIGPGETHDLHLAVSQSYSGSEVTLPVRVVRGKRPGPVLLVTAAVHGDELNGTGVVRELMIDSDALGLLAGSLILVPVVNILGFERQTRYLPDRRDLNRSFPGSSEGSLARRYARRVFDGLVKVADYGIDFHTAAVHRTNFPNVRGDLTVPAVRRLAEAFGCPLTVDHPGPKGSLRRAATDAGHATILLEAGEIWKVEPAVLEVGLRGVRNVLIELGMCEGEPEEPAFRAIADELTWLRTDVGGMLRFRVAPGDVVSRGQTIAECTSLLGVESGAIVSSRDGVVLSLTTLPTVKPGDPVCQLALLRHDLGEVRAVLENVPDDSLLERLRDDLASNIAVDDGEKQETADPPS